MTVQKHDAGGKSRWPLLPGVTGRAEYCGKNDCYRPWLSREWGARFADNYAVMIGANPSTAQADIDDLTVRKDATFVRMRGLDGFYKLNTMDFRATYPADLLLPGVKPCSDVNLATIIRLAERAQIVICCWGELHPSLRIHAINVEQTLRDKGVDLFCFGMTKSGAPKHTSRIAYDTPLIPFRQIKF